MNTIIRRQLLRRKQRIERRLAKRNLDGCSQPMFTARNIRYELAERSRGLACGGIGAMHLLARRLGLIDALDARLHLLKIHLPYHESDHVLAIAYNALCGGTCLEDLELRRNDEVFLDALGARRLPDPTTAGDFCRRFGAEQIRVLLDVQHDVRRRVWAQQPAAFFAQAVIDVDGSLVGTTGECKQGMDVAHDGTWGYHPLLVTLANTGEVLSLSNRAGNRPSHEGAAAEIDAVLAVCRQGGFRQVLLRGDTDFSQSAHLDRWAADARVQFLFGYDAKPNLKEMAEDLPASAWQPLARPPRYLVQTQPRARPTNVKAQIVRMRQMDNIRLRSEDVAEFDYRPTACQFAYRMVVVRKNLSVEKGEQVLFDDVRYLFYLTNDRVTPAAELVCLANDRGQQENLIEQLKNGVRALRAPLDNLHSNGAYMVMTALAWNLKAWFALSLPEPPGRWAERQRTEKRTVLAMEFKRFVNAFIQVPCQVVRTARRVLFRVLSWNRWQPVFFRVLPVLRC